MKYNKINKKTIKNKNKFNKNKFNKNKIKCNRKSIKKIMGGRYAKVTDIGKPLNGPINLPFLWGNAVTYCNECPFRHDF